MIQTLGLVLLRQDYLDTGENGTHLLILNGCLKMITKKTCSRHLCTPSELLNFLPGIQARSLKILNGMEVTSMILSVKIQQEM
jgi:hypothetical protein